MFTRNSVKRATKTKLRVSAHDRFERGNLQLHATGGDKAGTVWPYRHPVALYQGDAGGQGRSEDAAPTRRGRYTQGLHRPRRSARCEEKGGVVDLEKTRWYLDRLINEEISG